MAESLDALRRGLDLDLLGPELHGWVEELYPICRSITGPGLRQTLSWIGERLPIAVEEVPTGTRVLDWEVPREWRIREAWVEGPDGSRVVDFADHTLHVVNYSAPVEGTFTLEELRPRLHSLPDRPELVPYRTSYYREDWGFCLPHRTLEALPEGEYRVRIDSDLEPGSLSYGELVLPGTEADEILLSCHVCHPSLANDNLSGLVVSVAAARLLRRAERRFTYRFLWAPGTIGAITWLARNREAIPGLRGALVLACLGDRGAFHYKRSRRGTAEIDRAVEVVLAGSGEEHEIRDFVPWGYDERQYCSPGFDVPAGLLSRTPHGRFPEYHTSADDPGFVTPESLAGSVERVLEIVAAVEGNRRFRNLSPWGEPQLGRRGLYPSIGGEAGRRKQLALLWVLNLSDGEHDLLAVAERSGLPFDEVRDAADALLEGDLLEEVPER